MSHEPDGRAGEVPESTRKELEAAVVAALARCNRLGINWADFYQAVLAEDRLHPHVRLGELYEFAFRRLAAECVSRGECISKPLG